jgi:hypothetical protein
MLNMENGAALTTPLAPMRCLAQACEQAVQPGVRAIILGGAGLAGYAQALRAQCPLPLIDSAVAGLVVMLQGQAPAATRSDDGFYAAWQGMDDAFMRMSVQTGA